MIKTKIALAAALIAVFATPTLAQSPGGMAPSDVQPSYRWQGSYDNYPTPSSETQAPSHATRAPRLREGRNAAVIGNFGNGTSTGRDAIVQSLGN